MLKRFVRWLFGYLYIVLRGDYPEHFMNLCENHDILIWGVSCKQGQCSGYMKLKDYRQVRPLAKKSKTIPLIKRRYGFPFLVKRIRKRSVYFIGILLFCILLYTLSLFIWDISIEGGYMHTPEELLSYLNSTGVYSGCTIKDIDCPEIEENIRRDFSDIGWVSAQIKGTRLIVSIVETKVPVLVSDKKNTKLPYAHIIAANDGIVESIITRSGTPMVSVGDVVARGDILISGIIPVIGDDGLPIENKTVVADGDIRIKTFINYKDKFSMKYEYKEYTGASKKGYQLDVLDKKIFYVSPRNSYEHYDIINDVSTLKLVRNFFLPIKMTEKTLYEYNLHQSTYTQEQAYEKANKELLRYMETLKKNGVTIIDNQVKTTIENGICKSQGKIIVLEPAWNYTEIQDSEWRILKTDEHNGDNN
jgi:similar to stage IV sporulation protein